MGKIAVMVDAGYLLASSAQLLAGTREARRHWAVLAADEVMFLLTAAASMSEPADELLRVYWYDAEISAARLTEEQVQIAEQRNCKLRLGTLNGFGVQKGVDTLMVMDMLALSRNKAVTSLLVVTGDDDIRPAIESAQEHGVRVHLLGIEPLPGQPNQNVRLQRECDSFRSWGADTVAQFLSVTEPGLTAKAAEPAPNGSEIAHRKSRTLTVVADPVVDAINHALETATDDDLRSIVNDSTDDYVRAPQHIYIRLMGRYGKNLNDKDISPEAKQEIRRRLLQRVEELLAQGA